MITNLFGIEKAEQALVREERAEIAEAVQYIPPPPTFSVQGQLIREHMHRANELLYSFEALSGGEEADTIRFAELLDTFGEGQIREAVAVFSELGMQDMTSFYAIVERFTVEV